MESNTRVDFTNYKRTPLFHEEDDDDNDNDDETNKEGEEEEEEGNFQLLEVCPSFQGTTKNTKNISYSRCDNIKAIQQQHEAIAAIQKAWKESNDSFCLYQVHLDRFALGFLLQKWDTLCLLRHHSCCHHPQAYRNGHISKSASNDSTGSGSQYEEDEETILKNKTITKVILDECSFSGRYAVHLLIIFLQKLGRELKEISIMVMKNEASSSSPSLVSSLLGGLRGMESLESLVFQRVDLRGEVNGYHLRCILAKNQCLEVLQLLACQIDDAMYEQLLVGLRYHTELRYLNMGGGTLNDSQLMRLVDSSLVDLSCSYKNLEILDITQSEIGKRALERLQRRLKDQCMVIRDDDSSLATAMTSQLSQSSSTTTTTTFESPVPTTPTKQTTAKGKLSMYDTSNIDPNHKGCHLGGLHSDRSLSSCNFLSALFWMRDTN